MSCSKGPVRFGLLTMEGVVQILEPIKFSSSSQTPLIEPHAIRSNLNRYEVHFITRYLGGKQRVRFLDPFVDGGSCAVWLWRCVLGACLVGSQCCG